MAVKPILSDKLILAAGQNLKEREFWLENLSGNLVKSRFLPDYPPGDPEKPGNGEPQSHVTVDVAVAGDTPAKLLKLSGGADHKLHMILVAAVAVLLNKYGNPRDILLGVPVYRQEIETEFINTALVLRNRLTPTMTFKELLLQVRQTLLNAVDNQNYPLEILVKQLRLPLPETPEDDFPLFDVAVLLENIHDRAYLEHIPLNTIFSFERHHNRLQGKLEFSPRRYEKTTMEQIAGHFTHLLTQLLCEVDTDLDTIEILSEKERIRLLVHFNDTRPTGGSAADTVCASPAWHDLFERQVEKTPGNIALIGPGPSATHVLQLTYAELNSRANALAHCLRQKGVKPEILVALLLPPCPEMLVGILAVLKAGGAYLPLDDDYPVKRIGYMLADSQAAFLLTLTDHSVRAGFQGEILPLQESRWYHGNTSNPEPFARSENPAYLAYVIYTSGTTGKPKGVMVGHRNILCYLEAFSREFNVTLNDTVLQQSSYGFDVFVEECYPILGRGGKIAVAPRYDLLDNRRLLDFILRNRITFIDCTPLQLKEINKLTGLQSVHTFISGGDRLRTEYIDNLLKIGQVYNTYGPTEATVCTTYYRCPARPGSIVPIGKPIVNYSVYILDSGSRLLPLGVPGELCVSGGGITRGYMNRPELTAEKYCLRQPGGRFLKKLPPWTPRKNVLLEGECKQLSPLVRAGYILYRSGDLARWLQDGNIEFIGRIDLQVKIRGVRIEIGEIEDQLLKHKEIETAVVIAKDDQDNEKYLCAYIVCGSDLSVTHLREYLANTLPDYMIPSHFVQLKQIPLTTTGKIDRKSLSTLENERKIATGTEYAPPRNEIERFLVSTWAQVLGLKKEDIGIYENFFNLGGHSLKAIQIIEKSNQRGLKLSLQEIFQYQDIAALSHYLLKEQRNNTFHPPEPPDENKTVPQNQDYKPDHYSYYYPCKLGVTREKLRYENHYDLDKGVLLTANGGAVLGLGYKRDSGISGILEYAAFPFERLTSFPAHEETFGFAMKRRVFPSLAEELAYCSERLHAGELVLVTGTTYFLNYTPDYHLEKTKWLEKMDGFMEGLDRTFLANASADERPMAHLFILAAMNNDTYTVADITYNYFGKVPKEDIHKVLEGPRAVECLKNHISYDAYPSFEVVELNTASLKTYKNSELGLEILKKTTGYFLETKKLETKVNDNEKYVAFIGLSAIDELGRIAGKWRDNTAERSELLIYLTRMINSWKYKFIFLGDLLQDLAKYFPVLEKFIPGVEETITQWNRLYNDLESFMNNNNRNDEILAAFKTCRQKLKKISQTQQMFFSGIKETVTSIENPG